MRHPAAPTRWLRPFPLSDAPAWVPPAALLLYFLRFGYDYGGSDQDEVVPFLLHRLDPSLLTQDWFVGTQAAGFGVRSYFVTMLQSLAVFLPVWLAILLVYVVTWLALAAALYALGRRLTGDRLAASATVVVTLVLTPQWTLGGNDLASSMLVPSMAGWALGLWGLFCFLRARWLWAGVLLGLATWMQALVGLQLAGLLGVVLLGRSMGRLRGRLRPLLLFGAAFLIGALPGLGPLVVQQLSAASSAGEDLPSLFYIMAEFRNPHHYLFGSFPGRSLVRFGALALLGGASYGWLLRRRRVRHPGLLGALFGWIVVLCGVAFLFTEAVPSLPVAKLQLFKTTVPAKLLLVTLICGAVVDLLPGRVHGLARRLLDARWAAPLALALWLAALAGVGLGVDFLRAKARPLAHASTPEAALEAWARTETPYEAVFAVPPSWSGFRSRARRAIVVDFKAFPFQDRLIFDWFERLLHVAPIALPARGTPALQDQLDAAFLGLPPPRLLDLARRYGVDYVVRSTAEPPVHPAFERVFGAGSWVLYRVIVTDLAGP